VVLAASGPAFSESEGGWQYSEAGLERTRIAISRSLHECTQRPFQAPRLNAGCRAIAGRSPSATVK
jgi:hypothetical protein